jgi:peptidoglycan/LPS O-acetylase OafA/YrhL
MTLTGPMRYRSLDQIGHTGAIPPVQNAIQTQAAEPRTIGNIQLLRFFAAFIVLFGHAQVYIESRALTGVEFVEFSPFDFRAGVDIFFVISGFVMYYISASRFATPGYPAYFLGRRFIRICPLYWTATVAMLLAMFLAPSVVQHHGLGWQQTICSFLFAPYSTPSSDYLFPLVGVGWTLNYEMLFYFCFFVVLTLRRPVGLLLLAGGFGLAVLFHALVLGHTYVRFLSEWSDPIIIEFLFGVGLAIVLERGSRWSVPVGWLVSLLGVALLMIAQRNNMTQIQDFALYRPVILGIPALLICAGLALSDRPYASPSLRTIVVLGGNISFALYLTHEFAFNAVSIAWRTTKLSSPWLLIAVLCIASVVVSIILYHFFERPITRRLNRLFGAWAGHP